VIGLGLAGAFLGQKYISTRDKQIDQLYAKAIRFPDAEIPYPESVEAVRKLGKYPGKRVTVMLVRLAVGQAFPFNSDDIYSEAIRTVAIQELAKRKDATVSVGLAKLINPHERLAEREAAAEALEQLPCPDECVEAILQYLDRVSMGEQNYEELWLPSYGDTDGSLQRRERDLYGQLYEILQREKRETLAGLMGTYGLGTDAPSRFALELVTKVDMSPEACMLLKQSKVRGQDGELSQQVNSALAVLNCK
jgi:hypothetical protein